MEVVRAEEREPYVTRDGSTVREIAGPAPGNAANQSLAEATAPCAGETIEHLHRSTEEIYRFTSGNGRMRLGDHETEVSAGDVVVIPPGTPHKLWNTGERTLVVLCSCAPPYSHEDTVLCE
ncbi:MAG: cupin domain-containing protein [Solirubrobacterales bacterium]